MVVRGGGEDEGMTVKELKALWTIPMPYEDYPETEAVLMTGNVQLKWIGQLVASLQAAHAHTVSLVAAKLDAGATRPRVAFLEWTEPLF